MKKSTLLSLLTTAAIVTTTAGTYATWDNVTGNTSANITFRKPVTVEVAPSYTLTETVALNTIPSASGDVSFSIKNNTVGEKNLGKKLRLTPSILCSDGSVTLDKFNIEIIDKDKDPSKKLDEDNQNPSTFIDDSLDTTKYTINVTPKDDNTIGGKNITVELKAVLE